MLFSVRKLEVEFEQDYHQDVHRWKRTGQITLENNSLADERLFLTLNGSASIFLPPHHSRLSSRAGILEFPHNLNDFSFDQSTISKPISAQRMRKIPCPKADACFQIKKLLMYTPNTYLDRGFNLHKYYFFIVMKYNP